MKQERPSLRLVGDVGGTNARFALVDTGGEDRTPKAREAFLVDDFPSLEAAIDVYVDKACGGERPTEAVIAVAGPVIDGEARLTNAHWKMSGGGLIGHGFTAARLINDYEALVLAVPRLKGDDLAPIGVAPDQDGGTVAVIGAGTGLGVGALVRDGRNEAVAVTEGGHVAFAPTDEVEVEVLKLLAGRFGRVSLERILSGPGLVDLRWALGRIDGEAPEPLDPEAIVARAVSGADALCAETLRRFCAIYGAAAGDFALAFGATGGVYLGGGIAPRIVDALRAGPFRERFEAKGRFAEYLAPVPTAVIMHSQAALVGAASVRL